MHPHFIIGAIVHGTAIAVLAFFILFAASKAEGLIKILGTVLGIWVLILAILAVAAPVVGPMLGMPMDHMHRHWMQGGTPPDQAPPPPTVPPAKN